LSDIPHAREPKKQFQEEKLPWEAEEAQGYGISLLNSLPGDSVKKPQKKYLPPK
jgi:hypothetical protein